MSFKRNSDKYGDTPAPVTPYQKAAQVWDDRIGSARVQASNWRMAAFISMGLSLALASGLIWRSTQSIVTPYVIELTSDGAARTVGPASAAYEPTDAQIAYHLANFIKNVRSISIDPIVVRQNWLKAYDYATDRAAATLNDYARLNDPFTEVGRRNIAVEITSVVRSSDDSFEIRWRENAFRNGQPEASASFTASLSIVLAPPRDAETLHKNPLGVYVHGINWSKDLQGRE